MKSLIYKDLVNLKQQSRIFLLVMGLWIVMAVIERNATFVGGLLAVFGLLITITAYAYDERAGWDKYALTLPVGRVTVVASKYVLAVLSLTVSMAFYVAISMGIGADMRETLVTAALLIAVGLIASEVILPVIIRFGTEKGRFLLIALILLPSVLTLMMGRAGVDIAIEMTAEQAAAAALALSAVLFPVSLAVSIRIYTRKEF